MPLHVIGLGVSARALLDERALSALQAADLVIGSERQLDTVRAWLSSGGLKASQQVEVLPKLAELQPRLAPALNPEGLSIALLASGDPLFYGIGKWLARTFEQATAIHFYPAVSSIQVACHRMAWALQDVSVVSLHGRPADKLKTVLRTGRKLLILTDANSTPQVLASLCVESGFGDSVLTVCETLGYPEETIRRFKAIDLVQSEASAICFHALNICALEVNGDGAYLSRFPGIEDHHFVTDRDDGKGMLTKREVRLSVLSMLQPTSGDVIWDVGAGCGGVAVELGYWTPEADIYAIEDHSERLRCLHANQERFGLSSNLNIVSARAPQAFESLPAPNKVFIGGSGGALDSILSDSWQALPRGGVLVASAVTESTRCTLHAFYRSRLTADDCQYETSEVAVSRGETLAGELLYRPNLPVRLFKFTKRSLEKKGERLAVEAVESAGDNTVKGKLIGVGVGPGDPELLTIKAHGLIKRAECISYLIGPSGQSQAKQIARFAVSQRANEAGEIAISMPMSTDRTQANAAYDEGARRIREQLDTGKDVVFLCEGDPLFFGSFAYLLERLQLEYNCQVVPGISSVHAAAATLVQPLTLLRDSFAVVSGRHTDAQIIQALKSHDAVVIMKAGQSRPRILNLLRGAGRLEDAHYLENIGRADQQIVANVTELEPQTGPYFSLFVVLPSSRRPA